MSQKKRKKKKKRCEEFLKHCSAVKCLLLRKREGLLEEVTCQGCLSNVGPGRHYQWKLLQGVFLKCHLCEGQQTVLALLTYCELAGCSKNQTPNGLLQSCGSENESNA